MTESVCTRCWHTHSGIVCEDGPGWLDTALENKSIIKEAKTPATLSDRDQLLRLFSLMGVEVVNSTFWETVSLESKTPKVDGYTGAQVDFDFDKEGKFKSIYIYGAG